MELRSVRGRLALVKIACSRTSALSLGPWPRQKRAASKKKLPTGQDDQGPRPGGQARVRNLRLITLLVPAGVPRLEATSCFSARSFIVPKPWSRRSSVRSSAMLSDTDMRRRCPFHWRRERRVSLLSMGLGATFLTPSRLSRRLSASDGISAPLPPASSPGPGGGVSLSFGPEVRPPGAFA